MAYPAKVVIYKFIINWPTYNTSDNRSLALSRYHTRFWERSSIAGVGIWQRG